MRCKKRRLTPAASAARVTFPPALARRASVYEIVHARRASLKDQGSAGLAVGADGGARAVSRGARETLRSMKFLSSRTLPGKLRAWTAARSSGGTWSVLAKRL